MPKDYRFYRKVVQFLKKELPCGYPVSVRRVNMDKKYDGRCWKQGKKFYIEIARELDEWKAVDVLLHEWAHAYGWHDRLHEAKDDELFNRLSHDPLWGCCYAEVYSRYEKHFTQSKTRC
jgi:hypothetical protein